MGRLSDSGTGMDALRGLGAGEVLVDLRSGGVEALSPLWEDRLDLCLESRLFLDLGVSEPNSFSFSLSFEGMVKGRIVLEDGFSKVEGRRWGVRVSGLISKI